MEAGPPSRAPALGHDDLRAARAAGLITEAQAAGLVALAEARRGARAALTPGEEPFELFRGFNEIFVVVGLVILGLGWQGLALFVADAPGDWALLSAAAGALVWLLSEYFVRRRRMVAPAITLALFFGVAAAGVAGPLLFDEMDMISLDLSGIVAAAVAVAGALLVHFWRFRVPFSLALVALALFAALVLAISDWEGGFPQPRDLFLLGARGAYAWATLAFGIAVFAAAMAFDLSDPHRVTRRAANGFWLHVVAGPAIVNTLALTLLADPSPARLALLSGVLVALALVAVVIDRRSLLVAGAGYVVAVANALSEGGVGAAAAILGIGAALLVLGAAWEWLRARLLAPLGRVLPVGRLPPAHRPV